MKRKNKKPVTRAELEARLDAAIERTLQRRTALRLAERAMLDAREAIERFDAAAARPPAPVHCRCQRTAAPRSTRRARRR